MGTTGRELVMLPNERREISRVTRRISRPERSRLE